VASLNLSKLVENSKGDGALADTIGDMEKFFIKRYGVNLSKLKLGVLLEDNSSGENWIFFVKFPSGRFLTGFMNYPISKQMEVSGGYFLYALEKNLMVITKENMEMDKIIGKVMGKFKSFNDGFKVVLNSSKWIEILLNHIRLGELKNYIDFLTIRSDGKRIKLHIGAGFQKDTAYRKIREILKEKYGKIDEINKRYGYNFWVRNYTMFIRSCYVKKRSSYIELSGKLIQKSEELGVRLILPYIRKFVSDLKNFDERRECEIIREKISSKLYFEMKTRDLEFEKLLRRIIGKGRYSCPSGGRYFIDKTDGLQVKCSIHER
jgi:hypothetical protein